MPAFSPYSHAIPAFQESAAALITALVEAS